MFLIEQFLSAGFGFLPDSWKDEVLKIHQAATLQLSIQVTEDVIRIPACTGNRCYYFFTYYCSQRYKECLSTISLTRNQIVKLLSWSLSSWTHNNLAISFNILKQAIIYLNLPKDLMAHISVWLQLPCQDTLHIPTTGQTRTAKASSEIPPFELAGPHEWWSQVRPWIERLQTQKSCGTWMSFLAIRCKDKILWKAPFHF